MLTESNQQNNIAPTPKKRVLFVITQSEFGGAQRFLYSLISRLDHSKYEISAAVGTDGGGELISALKQKNIPVSTLNYLVRNLGIWRDLKALKELKKLLIQTKPDILFLLSSKAGFIGSMAVKQSKLPIKVIYRIGGWTFNDPWPIWKKTAFFLLEKISAKWKDIIIVNNRHDFEQAKKMGIKPKDQLKLISNGLDVYKMDFLPRENARLKLFEKISKHSGKVFQVKTIVGAIANFYPAKGLEYFIETAVFFKENDEIIFVIIGDGEERPKLEKLISEKGLEKKIFLLGQIPDAYKLLSAFDVFVLTSVKEGFPWVLIEAMAAKLPVVASAVGAVPEIIQSGKNGLIVPPRDAQATAKAIKTALEGSKTGLELGIQAHQTVLFKYDLEQMVSQVEKLL